MVRMLDLLPGGPGFKCSSLSLAGFVFSGPEFNWLCSNRAGDWALIFKMDWRDACPSNPY